MGILDNILNPVILFFAFGMLAGSLRSNLEIPPAIGKFLSLYLLLAIGFKGGTALAATGLSLVGALAILAALIMATIVPIYSFFILRKKTNPYDAAAIAATFGSISAVTFITAQQFLTSNELEYGGHMTVAMVLMEMPAIILAMVLVAMVRKQEALKKGGKVENADAPKISMSKVLHEAFTDGAFLLLMGSLTIGYITGADGAAIMKPFIKEMFMGFLAFFLLDMGLIVAKQLRESTEGLNKFMFAFSIVMPVVNATVSMGLAWIFGLSVGDALLLAVLAASASYIVVPAVVRYAIPEARAGTYFTMAIGFTFPFNIIIGIPLYYAMISYFWGL
ncbi:MAG: sodium-dependent bicarbonate transport family permease [Sulfurimonas sp.]|nr:sodium-dependent bicarbonate transport family permease [Sulfurimonas sp.]